MDLIKENNQEKRKNLKDELNKEIQKYYLVLNLEKEHSYYYLSKEIENMNLDKVNSGEERFKFIQNWVAEKEKILPIFIKD
jgi:hypothetical protein